MFGTAWSLLSATKSAQRNAVPEETEHDLLAPTNLHL